MMFHLDSMEPCLVEAGRLLTGSRDRHLPAVVLNAGVRLERLAEYVTVWHGWA
jgi:hypothetical protein